MESALVGGLLLGRWIVRVQVIPRGGDAAHLTTPVECRGTHCPDSRSWTDSAVLTAISKHLNRTWRNQLPATGGSLSRRSRYREESIPDRALLSLLTGNERPHFGPAQM